MLNVLRDILNDINFLSITQNYERPSKGLNSISENNSTQAVEITLIQRAAYR
jgi:hypothetical protein